MKYSEHFTFQFKRLSESRLKKVITAQKNACQQICEDVKQGAPVRTGAYRDSIKTTDPKVTVLTEGKNLQRTRIVTDIYSDCVLVTDNPKWNGFPLARIIEYGTSSHFIFPRNAHVLRWEDENGVHFAKYVHHPGTAPVPHWKIAMWKNKETYTTAIRRALNE